VVREGMVAVGIWFGPRELRGERALVVKRIFKYANKRWNLSGCRSGAMCWRRREGRPGTENLALGAAQCAASNRPLPGAETALILYHRYFFREEPCPASD